MLLLTRMGMEQLWRHTPIGDYCVQSHVFGLIPENSNNIPPNKSTGAPVTVLRFVDMGNRSVEWRPRCASIEIGTVVSWAPVSAHDCTLVFLAGLSEGLGIGNLRSAYAALSIFTDRGRVGLGIASCARHPAYLV